MVGYVVSSVHRYAPRSSPNNCQRCWRWSNGRRRVGAVYDVSCVRVSPILRGAKRNGWLTRWASTRHEVVYSGDGLRRTLQAMKKDVKPRRNKKARLAYARRALCCVRRNQRAGRLERRDNGTLVLFIDELLHLFA